MTGWLLIGAAAGFWAFLSWCLCRVAGQADEQLERLFRSSDAEPTSVVDLDEARRARRTA